MATRLASVWIRGLVGTAAGLLALGGVAGLGLRGNDAGARAGDSGTAAPPVDSSPTHLLMHTGSSVHDHRPTLPVLAPATAVPPLSESSLGERATDVSAARSEPACSTARLTVIAIEGCPVATLIGAVVATTEEAAALPK
ncbi:MAG: hypothetical protein Q8K63_01765 [Acidimicrobiales bacterium]|nr:hypothetical protein [Acidimicrobiales bacterium]